MHSQDSSADNRSPVSTMMYVWNFQTVFPRYIRGHFSVLALIVELNDLSDDEYQC